MQSIEQLLENKGHDIWSIGPDASVFDAIEMMDEKGVGALLVMSDGDLVGVISERDYARKVILKGRSSRKTPIEQIMTTDVVCAQVDQNIEACMSVMTHKRIRHLPITRDGQLVGVGSLGDLVKAVIADQEAVIEQLEHYISG
jgi:CBS domain-containing protein